MFISFSCKTLVTNLNFLFKLIKPIFYMAIVPRSGCKSYFPITKFTAYFFQLFRLSNFTHYSHSGFISSLLYMLRVLSEDFRFLTWTDFKLSKFIEALLSSWNTVLLSFRSNCLFTKLPFFSLSHNHIHVFKVQLTTITIFATLPICILLLLALAFQTHLFHQLDIVPNLIHGKNYRTNIFF